MTRVVVTGLGCISSLGHNLGEFEDSLFSSRSGVGNITLFDTSQNQIKVAAEVKGYDFQQHFSERDLPFYDRYTQFAVISSREACRQSGLEGDGRSAERSASLYGTAIGGVCTIDEVYHRLFVEGEERLHPFTIPKLVPSAASSHVSMDRGLTGPAFGTVSACSSSGHSIATGVMMLKSGVADVAYTGGADAPICYGSVKAWECMRVLAKDTCRPFSRQRGGMLIGEGAATLILETEEHANARGAHILAEVVGFGMSSDADNIVKPTVDGPARAMSLALQSAGIAPDSIQYINAHGTGTAQNDPTETRAIHRVFGAHASKLAVSSTKSMHGHTMGAAGALEAIATINALRKQTVPATINYLGQDPDCDLDYVPNEARDMFIQYAMSNSFAFGGLNVSLVFGLYN